MNKATYFTAGRVITAEEMNWLVDDGRAMATGLENLELVMSGQVQATEELRAEIPRGVIATLAGLLSMSSVPTKVSRRQLFGLGWRKKP